MAEASKEAYFTNDDLWRQYIALPTVQREQVFLSTARAAKRVGVSSRTIQLWIEGGKIKAIAVGRKYKVHFGSLLAYIEAHIREKE